MRRADTLDKAKMIVTGERNQEYGGPESTFGSIAKLWSAYLEVDIAAEDVAVLMILLKVARLAGSAYSSADSWVDIAGYAACGSEISGCEEAAAGSKASEELKKSNDELREKLAAMTEEYTNLSVQCAELEAQLRIAQNPAPAAKDPEPEDKKKTDDKIKEDR